MTTLHHDTELENSILFYHYVMVLMDGKMIGGGLIEAYNEDEIQVGSIRYSREKSTFLVAPAPQASIYL